MELDITGKNKEQTKEWFSRKVESLVKSDRIPYMDATLALCVEHDIEPALAANMISDSITQKIEAEAISLNLYKDASSSLPGI